MTSDGLGSVLNYDQVKPKATTLVFLLPRLAILIKEQQSIYNHLYNQYLPPVILSLNPVHCEVHPIQHYVIKFVSNLRHICGFFSGAPVSSTNKTDGHDITEIVLKVSLSITHNPYAQVRVDRTL